MEAGGQSVMRYWSEQKERPAARSVFEAKGGHIWS